MRCPISIVKVCSRGLNRGAFAADEPVVAIGSVVPVLESERDESPWIAEEEEVDAPAAGRAGSGTSEAP